MLNIPIYAALPTWGKWVFQLTEHTPWGIPGRYQGAKEMPLKTEVSDDGSVVTLHVTGNMDYSIFSALKKATHDHCSDKTHIVVDFRHGARLHDSGLGTLLSLTRKNSNCIDLINCTPEIVDRISHSTFQSRFKVAD